MVCACYLLFQATYFCIVLGYPLKCLYELDQNKKTDKKWIYYFFLLTILYLGEITIFFPIKYVLSKICFCMFPTLKAIFAFWLYYPKQNGIDMIESKVGKHIDTAFLKINPLIGSFMEKIGIENKDISGSSKRSA